MLSLRILFPLCLTAAFASAAPGQDAPSRGPSSVQDSLPKVEDLEVRFYQPQRCSALELAASISDLFPNKVFVNTPTGGVAIDRFSAFGESVVLRDRPARLDELVETLQRLDEAFGAGLSGGEDLEVLEYSPRFVAVESLYSALEPFRRPLMINPRRQAAQQAGRAGGFTNNIQAIQDSGKILLRDTAANLAKMQEALAKIDVPEPQVQLVCYLLQGASEADAGGLPVPADLAENLGALVPYQSFQTISMGILRSGMASGRTLSLQMSGNQAEFSLNLRTAAYSIAHEEVSFSDCQFQITPHQARPTSFQTRLRAKLRDYTVLGAIGRDPIFVVLQVLPIR